MKFSGTWVQNMTHKRVKDGILEELVFIGQKGKKSKW